MRTITNESLQAQQGEQSVAYNSINPVSLDIWMKDYPKQLRDADHERDKICSPLFDYIMGAIFQQAKEWSKEDLPDIFYTLFVERTTYQILRGVELFINQKQKP